jgi:phage-related protein
MSNLPLPDYTPVYPATKTVKPRQRTAKLPNWGIEQRATQGQHQTLPEWQVKWLLEPGAANTLDAFLAQQAQTGSWFVWTPPGATQGRFRCDDWTKQLSSCNIYEVTATFRQVFDPARPFLSGAFVAYFTLTGRSTALFRSYILRPGTGSVSLSGNNNALGVAQRISTSTGAFVLTGNNTSFFSTYILSPITGSLALNGNDIALDKAQGVLLAPGAFVLTANNVSFSLGGGSSPPATADAASFWSDWAYYDPDIFLYEQGTATESPVYWNRWQSWTEDPPLLFEESS